MKFIDVDPNDIADLRDTRRGRVSYPLTKSFLETNKFVVMVDRTGIQQSLQSLTSSVGSYIRNHDLPIKMFTRGGNLYLMRLDIDEAGNAIPDWNKQEAGADATPIDDAEVEKRYQEEKGKSTK